MGVFNAVNILELFNKTGSLGTVGATSHPLSAMDGPDARGKASALGRYPGWLFEVIYKRGGNDGQFYLEGALENQNGLYSPLSYVRLDTGVVVPAATPLTLTADTRLLIATRDALGLLWVRPVCFTSGGISPTDAFAVRTLERQA